MCVFSSFTVRWEERFSYSYYKKCNLPLCVIEILRSYKHFLRQKSTSLSCIDSNILALFKIEKERIKNV